MKLKKARAVELAWVAGLMDGDGHISVHWVDGSHRKIYFRVRASITNCDRSAMERVQQILGEGRVTQPRYHRSEVWRPISTWTSDGAAAQRALVPLMPYLYIKKEQARLVLMLPHRSRAEAPRRDTIFTRIAQAVIALRVRELKHEGQA